VASKPSLGEPKRNGVGYDSITPSSGHPDQGIAGVSMTAVVPKP